MESKFRLLSAVLLLLVAATGCSRMPPAEARTLTAGLGSPAATPALTPLPASFWLTQVSVFFQPGDLPEAVQLVQFDNKNPVFALKLGESPDGTANLSFAVQSGNVQGGLDYGVVTLLYFKDLGMLQKASQWLIQEDEPVRQPTPEAGIGESALLFLAEQPGEGTALDFQVCHAVVQIRLFIDDPTVILRYSGRLAEPAAAGLPGMFIHPAAHSASAAAGSDRNAAHPALVSASSDRNTVYPDHPGIHPGPAPAGSRRGNQLARLRLRRSRTRLAGPGHAYPGNRRWRKNLAAPANG